MHRFTRLAYCALVRAFRIVLALALVLGLASTSTAAPTAGGPVGYTRFALGGPEHEFVDIQTSASGWLMTGTTQAEAGDQALVTSVDLSGKTLWQRTLGPGVGMALTTNTAGAVWVARIHPPVQASPEPTPSPTPTNTSPSPSPTPTTPVPTTPAPTPSAPIDPDGVGRLDELNPGRSASAITVHLLDASGNEQIALPLALDAGWVMQPAALVPWKDGVLVVGTAVSPSGALAGVAVPVTGAGVAAPVFLGSTSTQFTSAAVSSTGVVLIGGSSSETLLGKARLGTQDAIVTTFNSRFTKVIRSGGGQRIWTTLSANPAGGYSAAGWALASGRREAVLSTFSPTGVARWSKRYAGSVPAQEQRLTRIANTLRLAFSASTASATAYPGWTPKGASDLLVLTLDPNTGATLKVTVLGGSGREELVDAAGAAAGGAVLFRTDGQLAAASGTGAVILARLGTR